MCFPALKKLAKGTLQVLVCSDVLSRGIDVAGVTLVVNYDAPSHPKTYIHRNNNPHPPPQLDLQGD